MHINEGSNPNTITLLGNEHVFQKTRRSDSLVYRIDTELQNIFLFDYPFHRHRLKVWPTGFRKHEKEAKTAQLWKRAGIPTTAYRSHSRDVISYDLSKGISLSRRFSVGWDEDIFSKFLKVYNSIRELALSTNNSDYFHSDPALCNFLYEEDKILAFDSATVLNPFMGMQDLDSHLLLYTLFDLAARQKDIKNKALPAFVDSLSSQKRTDVKNVRYNSWLPLAFGHGRTAIAKCVKGRNAGDSTVRYRECISQYEEIMDHL